MVPSVEVKKSSGKYVVRFPGFWSKTRWLKYFSMPEIPKHDFISSGAELFNRIPGPKAVKNGKFITAFTQLRYFVAGHVALVSHLFSHPDGLSNPCDSGLLRIDVH